MDALVEVLAEASELLGEEAAEGLEALEAIQHLLESQLSLPLDVQHAELPCSDAGDLSQSVDSGFA